MKNKSLQQLKQYIARIFFPRQRNSILAVSQRILLVFIVTIAIPLLVLRITSLAVNKDVVIDTDGSDSSSGDLVVIQEDGAESVSKLKFETGSVSPQFGGPGTYQFSTYFIDPQNRNPDSIKIFITNIDDVDADDNLSWESHDMVKGPWTSNRGVNYIYERTFTTSEEGVYSFYFEAKIGNEVIHGPAYFSDDCTPGLCAECCGAWGGPKIIPQNLIDNHSIYMFDKDKDNYLWHYDIGENWVTSVAISDDSKLAIAADNQANLYVFDIASGDPIWTFQGDPKLNDGDTSLDRGLVALSQNGYIAASLKGIVYFFKINDDEPIWSHDIGMTLNGLEISGDGKYIAAGGRDTYVYLWNTQDPEPSWSYKVESEGGILGGSVIRSMDMAADGKSFVTGTSCPDRSIYVFSSNSSEPIFRAEVGSNFPAETVSISEDGALVLVGGGGAAEDPYSALLYKVGTTNELWKFSYVANPTLKVALSPDGQLFALGFILGGIYSGESSSANPIWQLKNVGYIADLDFSSDNKYLALGSGNNHVFLLSAQGDQIYQDWEVDNKVESIDISSDGKYVIAGTSLDKFIALSEEKGGSSDAEEEKAEIIQISEESGESGTQSQKILGMTLVQVLIICILGTIILSISIFLTIKKKYIWIVPVLIVGILAGFVVWHFLGSTGEAEKTVDTEEDGSGDGNLKWVVE